MVYNIIIPGCGGTLIVSYIRRLGPFIGVQNFEFQYFVVMKILSTCLGVIIISD